MTEKVVIFSNKDYYSSTDSTFHCWKKSGTFTKNKDSNSTQTEWIATL